MDTSRSLLLFIFVLCQFWPYNVFIAIYLINLMPSTILSSIFPHKHLYMFPRPTPTSVFLVVPSSPCSLLMSKPNYNQPAICVFFGYNTNHKGFRCYDPIVRRLHISHDVMFLEGIPYCARSRYKDSLFLPLL